MWDSVAWGRRLAEYKAYEAAKPKAIALVEKLRKQMGDFENVANAIETDRTIDEVLREVALDEVLIRASKREDHGED